MLDLDPVWPWARLYDILRQAPPGAQTLALLSALLGGAIPVALFARARLLSWALVGATALSLLFVVRHLWTPALADAEAVTGGGVLGFLVGVAWVVGLVLLLQAPFILAGLSVAAYVGTEGVSKRKVAVVVGLRLLAFLLALIAVARPAFAWTKSESSRSVLYVLIDRSRSMTIEDELGGRSRWRQVKQTLDMSRPSLERLKEEQQVEVRFFSFDSELRDFDLAAPGEADGRASDYVAGIRGVYERREGNVFARGFLVIGDGGDNVNPRAYAEQQAARWRAVPCPVHTFVCGSAKTSQKQKDVAITSISTSASPFVAVKEPLTVTVFVDARGFEGGQPRKVKLFLEGEDGTDREVANPTVTVNGSPTANNGDAVLPLTTRNEVKLTTQAPDKPGEYKVKVTIDRPEGDHFEQNNTIETFVSVSKEGISVLLVDRLRAGEPQAICDVLREEGGRVRLTPLWLGGGKLSASDARSVLAKPFDVIILGDVSLAMLEALDKNAPQRIADLVKRGAGLIVLGGLTNLGNGGWAGEDSPLEKLLPVDLKVNEQHEDREGRPLAMPMMPTQQGLTHMRYLFTIDERKDDAGILQAWKDLNYGKGKGQGKDRWLYGATKLVPKEGSTVYARSEPDGKDKQQGHVLLVGWLYAAGGKGGAAPSRVLVFGGDTTHRWIRDDRGREFFSRFWRQTVVWLSRQEDAQGQVWVRPDARRIPARAELGFAVGMRGKGGGPDVRDGKFDVKVITPAKQEVPTPLAKSETETRGTFTSTQAPGVYRIEVHGQGTDPAGGAIDGKATGRVIVYDEDVEMSRPAADPEFMAKVASAGGGEALPLEELPQLLARLAERPLQTGREATTRRPDWQTTERSPFLMLFFAAFCVVVSLEWGLRRWWGLK